jgi:hypothetical protein
MRVTDGTRYAVIGSKGGASTPSGTSTSSPTPRPRSRTADDVGRYRGHVAEGDERADW